MYILKKGLRKCILINEQFSKNLLKKKKYYSNLMLFQRSKISFKNIFFNLALNRSTLRSKTYIQLKAYLPIHYSDDVRAWKASKIR